MKLKVFAVILLLAIFASHVKGQDVSILSVTNSIVDSLFDLQRRFSWTQGSQLQVLDILSLRSVHFHTDYDLSDISGTAVVEYKGIWVWNNIPNDFEVRYRRLTRRYSFGALRNIADVDVQDPYDNNTIIRFQTPEAQGMITESNEAYFILHDSSGDNKRYRVHHATLGSDMPPSDIVIGLEYRDHSFQDVMRRVIDLTGIPYFETAMATRIGIIASGRTINLDGERVFPNSYGLDRLFPTINQGLTGYVTFSFSSPVDVEWLMTCNGGEDSVTFVPTSPITLNTFLNGMAVDFTYPAPLPMEIMASTTISNFTLYGGREQAISIEVDYPNLSFFYGNITFSSYVVRYTISTARALTVTVTGDFEIGGTKFRTTVGIDQNENAYMLRGTSTGTIGIQQVIEHFRAGVFGGLPLDGNRDTLPITSYSISQPFFSHTFNVHPEEISIGGNIDMRRCVVHSMDIILRRHYVRNLDYTNILIQKLKCTTNLQTFLGLTDGVDILTSEATATMITTPIDLTNHNMPKFLSGYARLYKGLSVVARQGFPKSCENRFCFTIRSYLRQDYRFIFRFTIQDIDSFSLKDDIEIHIGKNAVLSDAKLKIGVNSEPTASIFGSIMIQDQNLTLESSITNDARLLTIKQRPWIHPFGANYFTITHMEGNQAFNPNSISLNGTFELGRETCQSPLTAPGEIIIDPEGKNHKLKAEFAKPYSMTSVIHSMGIMESATISWPTSDGNFISGFTYTFSATTDFHFSGKLNLLCILMDADVTVDSTTKIVKITSHFSQIKNIKDNSHLIIDDDSAPLSMNGILFPAPRLEIHGSVKAFSISEPTMFATHGLVDILKEPQPATLEITSCGYSIDISGNENYTDLHIYAGPEECIETVEFKVRGRFSDDFIQNIQNEIIMKANKSLPNSFDPNDDMTIECARLDICKCISKIFNESCSSFEEAIKFYEQMRVSYYDGDMNETGKHLQRAKVKINEAIEKNEKMKRCLEASSTSLHRIKDYLDEFNLTANTPVPKIQEISFDVPLSIATKGKIPGTALVQSLSGGGRDKQLQITVDTVENMVEQLLEEYSFVAGY